jgi:hypothetical protein
MKTEKLFEEFLITFRVAKGVLKTGKMIFIYKRRIENTKKFLKNVIHTYIPTLKFTLKK